MSSAPNRLRRFLSVYKKNADEPCGEIPLNELDVKKIRNVLDLSDDDPVAYVYAVDEKLKCALQPHSARLIDLAAFDYFLECESMKSI